MSVTDAQTKPPYLGLLNAIALAETQAGHELRAWADATPDPDLACVLRFVAARETSHGEVFRRRLNELGFDVREKTDPKAERRIARLADPAVSDCDKIPAREGGDPFTDIHRQLAERRFDPMTANLLTWYVAEEYDSGRRLAEAYDCIRERHAASAPAAGGHAPDTAALLACMSEGFARLEKSIDRLAKTRK